MVLATATAGELAKLHPARPQRGAAAVVQVSPVRPATAAGRFYRPELDALRLVAFLMVWLSHSLPTAADLAAHGLGAHRLTWLVAVVAAIKDAGNFGVCVFFFLSAYLITELLRREQLLTGAIHLRAFYLRRVLRIWPLYLGVLGAYALLGLRFHGFRIEPGRLLASVLLAGNWYIAWHPAILTPMRALWSLSVEEQFYLGWPVLARSASPRALGAACLALLLLGQGTLFWLARPTSPQPSMLHVTAWVNSLVQFQFFALGAFAAVLLQGRSLRLKPLPRAALAASAAAALLLAAWGCRIKGAIPVHTRLSLAAGYLLAGLGCALLFSAVLGLRAESVPAWSVRLGQISFGLYVFHETGFFLADWVQKRLPASAILADGHAHWAAALALNKAVALLFTILLAMFSYHFWERPFLRLKDRFASIPSRPA